MPSHNLAPRAVSRTELNMGHLNTAIHADQSRIAFIIMACAAVIWATSIFAYQDARIARAIAEERSVAAQVESDRAAAQEHVREQERATFERLGIY